MKPKQFFNTLVSLVIAFVCYALCAILLVILPALLCIEVSWWWLFLAIPTSAFAWYLIYWLGDAVESIWN